MILECIHFSGSAVQAIHSISVTNSICKAIRYGMGPSWGFTEISGKVDLNRPNTFGDALKPI